LHRKIIEKCKGIAEKEGIELHKTYTRTVKKLTRALRFRHHPNQYAKARKSGRKLKTISGKLDTLRTNPLQIKGTVPLLSVNFLKPSLKIKPDIEPQSEYDFPQAFFLLQNFPNPFNPTTTIQYKLANESQVTMTVFNLLGEEVATLMNNEEYPEGTYSIDFDAAGLSSGIYFYRLTAIPLDDEGLPVHLVKKMVVVK